MRTSSTNAKTKSKPASIESLRGIAETKTHYWKLEQAEGRSDGGFVYVVGGGRNLNVGANQVELGENHLFFAVK